MSWIGLLRCHRISWHQQSPVKQIQFNKTGRAGSTWNQVELHNHGWWYLTTHRDDGTQFCLSSWTQKGIHRVSNRMAPVSTHEGLEKPVKSPLLMKNCSNQGLTTMLDSSVHSDHWIIDNWSKKETTQNCNLLDYNSKFWSYKQLNYPRHYGEFKIERSVLRCQAQWR